LTVAEAMATGLAVIVPDRGAMRDFCGPGTGILVESREVELPAPPPDVPAPRGRPRAVEVSVEDLAARMRWAYEHPGEAAAIGARAAAAISRGHTWDHAATAALRRVRALKDGAVLPMGRP
jgi:glycosyltransferase involved in cell wall biosynthesis